LQDSYGRTIDHLRISVTDRCGLRCIYCMPEGAPVPAARHEILRFEEIAGVVQRMRDRFGLKRVRITGGEPLVRSRLAVLIRMLCTVGLDEISMTTNGQALARSAGALAAAGLRRVNVSLDSLRADRYREITGGDLARTLEGIEAAARAGLRPLKINSVITRGNECDIEELTDWALARGYQIRFLELMAIGCLPAKYDAVFVPTREVRDRLKRRFRMEPIEAEAGSPARLWHAEGERVSGTVGFVSPVTEPFCSACRRLRLTARGMLLGCIMHEDGPDLRAVLRSRDGIDEAAFDAVVRLAAGSKPLERIRVGRGRMVAIGG